MRIRNLSFPEVNKYQRVEKGDGSMGKEQEVRRNEAISSFGTFSAYLVLIRC
jgi:hypothetical protein